MTLSSYPLGAVLTELDGCTLVPPLVLTRDGWSEQAPAQCSACRGSRLLVGWSSCACRTDALAPGHRTWTCGACGHRERAGCLDAAAQRGPMEEYGCAIHPDTA